MLCNADRHKAFMVAVGSGGLDSSTQIGIGGLLDRVGAQFPFASGIDCAWESRRPLNGRIVFRAKVDWYA
jgi:hypothetical protein